MSEVDAADNIFTAQFQLDSRLSFRTIWLILGSSVHQEQIVAILIMVVIRAIASVCRWGDCQLFRKPLDSLIPELKQLRAIPIDLLKESPLFIAPLKRYFTITLATLPFAILYWLIVSVLILGNGLVQLMLGQSIWELLNPIDEFDRVTMPDNVEAKTCDVIQMLHEISLKIDNSPLTHTGPPTVSNSAFPTP